MNNADLIDWFNDRGSKKLSDVLLLLWPGDIWDQLEEMNKHIRENVNVENKKNGKRIIAPVVKSELLTFIALLIASAITAAVGRNLFFRLMTTLFINILIILST